VGSWIQDAGPARRRGDRQCSADQDQQVGDEDRDEAIFISKASIFLPRYSGVRPTMSRR
jgi:hypothetical protein